MERFYHILSHFSLRTALVFLLLYANTAFAQSDFCATNRVLNARATLHRKMAQNDATLLAKANKMKALRNDSTTIYTIPVVFHTIENQDGDGHVEDSILLQTLNLLNKAYANEPPYYNPSGVDTRLRFCLAQRTPANDTTKGINRKVSRFAYHDPPEEEDSMKLLSQWDSHNYLNIWTVKDIVQWETGLQYLGYAYPPAAHGDVLDGVVVVSSILGTTPTKIAVLAHEIGHYLGLYHTFEGDDCLNNDCAINGDRVCDTPPDNERYGAMIFNSCTTDADSPNSPFTSDVNDFTLNFMDYSDFSQIMFFTKGQADRMRNALTELRASLLESKGCAAPCTAPIVASIQASATTIAAGTNVTFATAAGNTLYEWRINNQTFSTTENANFTPQQTGDYQIVLHIENGGTHTCVANDTLMVTVVCSPIADFSASVNGNNGSFSTALAQPIWAVNNGINDLPLGNASSANYTFPNDGVYQICLRDAANACALPLCKTYTIGTLATTYCPDKALILTNANQNYLHTGVYDAATLTTFWGGRTNKTNPSAILVHVDTCNRILWSKTYWTGAAANIISLRKASDDNLILLGSDDATHYYIAKINAQTGDALWTQRIASSTAITLQEMKIIAKSTADETFMVLYQTDAGALGLHKWRDDGTLLAATEVAATNYRLAANALTAVNEDDIAVVGAAQLSTTQNAINQPFVLHFNPNTNTSQLAVHDANAQNAGYTDVVSVAGGGLLVAGWSRILPNRFTQNTLSYINADGNVVFAKTDLNTATSVVGSRLTKDKNGNYLWFSVKNEGLEVEHVIHVFNSRLELTNAQNIGLDFGNNLDNNRLPPITMSGTTSEHLLLGSFKINIFTNPKQADGAGLCTRFMSPPTLCTNAQIDFETAILKLKTAAPLTRTLLNIATQHTVIVPNTSPTIAATNASFQQFNPCCELQISGFPKMCAMPSQVLTATPGFDTYVWNTSATTDSITITAPNLYNVIAEKACSRCRAFFDVRRYTPKTEVEIGTDTIFICKGTDTLLHVQEGFLLYEWDNGTRDSTRLVDTSGVFWINAIDSCDQVFHDTVRVMFLTAPNLVQALADTLVCFGTAIDLLGSPNYHNYAWISNGSLSCDTCTNTIITISDTLTQIIIKADNEACSVSDTLRLHAQPPIRAMAEASALQCFGDTTAAIQVHILGGGTAPFSYQLDTAALVLDSNFLHLGAAIYTVSAIDVLGCKWKDTIEIIAPLPFALHTFEPEVKIIYTDSVQLGLYLTNIDTQTILWQPSIGLSCTACTSPIANPQNTQLYTVIGKNDMGCIAKDSVHVIVVEECAVFIPNIFTPNGDGNNDIFQLFSNNCGNTLVNIKIFDRFGEFVFEAGNMPIENFKGWDGTMRNLNCNTDVYVYVIEIENRKGKRTIATGDVTLIR